MQADADQEVIDVRLRCLLGRHDFAAMRQADRTDRMGRQNPLFDRCRACGYERDRPIAHWDRPDVGPF